MMLYAKSSRRGAWAFAGPAFWWGRARIFAQWEEKAGKVLGERGAGPEKLQDVAGILVGRERDFFA